MEEDKYRCLLDSRQEEAYHHRLEINTFHHWAAAPRFAVALRGAKMDTRFTEGCGGDALGSGGPSCISRSRQQRRSTNRAEEEKSSNPIPVADRWQAFYAGHLERELQR